MPYQNYTGRAVLKRDITLNSHITKERLKSVIWVFMSRNWKRIPNSRNEKYKQKASQRIRKSTVKKINKTKNSLESINKDTPLVNWSGRNKKHLAILEMERHHS